MKHLELKGVMIDMARVTERHGYYRALPERLAAWGYNTLFAHFTDDEGCAMEFGRRPELATPHAFTQVEMRKWVAAAATAGITIIPELESFGHTAYIHGRKKYAHLREPTSGIFNAINPLHRDTRAILRDLVEETAGVFDAPFIHAGLDEVNFGASPQVRKALAKRQSWEIFAGHVNLMHGLITRAGRRMMMWGDHLLHEPRIADAVSKDIVICDWHYQANVSPATVEFFTKRGFEVVCCPASNRSGDMVLPNAVTQINLQRSARIAHAGGKLVVGLMNTVWCPMRMLCGLDQLGMALGGAWFNDPSADPRRVVAAFLRGQYGLARPDAAAEAVLKLSAIMPQRDVLRRLMGSETPASIATTRALAPARSGVLFPLTARESAQAQELFDQSVTLGELLVQQSRGVTANHAEFGNYILAAELLSWAAMTGLSRALPAGQAAGLRRRVLAEGRHLLIRAQTDWNRGRHPDDPKRDLDGQPARWPDALIPNLLLALTRLR